MAMLLLPHLSSYRRKFVQSKRNEFYRAYGVTTRTSHIIFLSSEIVRRIGLLYKQGKIFSSIWYISWYLCWYFLDRGDTTHILHALFIVIGMISLSDYTKFQEGEGKSAKATSFALHFDATSDHDGSFPAFRKGKK